MDEGDRQLVKMKKTAVVMKSMANSTRRKVAAIKNAVKSCVKTMRVGAERCLKVANAGKPKPKSDPCK